MSVCDRSQFAVLVVVAMCMAFAACGQIDSSTGDQREQGRPNIVLILVDDLGWSDLAVQGSSFYETPNIDAMASTGVRFTNAYASAPICSPTRAALLTGKHPASLQITNWIPGDDPLDRPLIGPAIRHQLPLDEFTIAEALKAEGYATYFAGKWHLGDGVFLPQNQGFDVNVGGVALGRPPGGYYSPYSNPALVDGPDGEYLTDRLTSETIRFFEQNHDRPFFALLSFYAVHTPLQGADRFMEKYEYKSRSIGQSDEPGQVAEHAGYTKQRQDNVAYASMVHALDENVGRLVAALDELELLENTYIFFTSDNGGRSTLYGAGDATSNLPLRAGKGWLYEGGIRVPLIVSGPGLDGGAVRDSALVTSTDFYPTILDLAGAESIPQQHQDGVNFKDALLAGRKTERNNVVSYFPHYHGSASVPSIAIRRGRYKLIQFLETNEIELYDLEEDIGESINIVDSKREVASELLGLIEQWRVDIGAMPPTLNENYVPGEEQLNFRGLGPQ